MGFQLGPAASRACTTTLMGARRRAEMSLRRHSWEAGIQNSNFKPLETNMAFRNSLPFPPPQRKPPADTARRKESETKFCFFFPYFDSTFAQKVMHC